MAPDRNFLQREVSSGPTSSASRVTRGPADNPLDAGRDSPAGVSPLPGASVAEPRMNQPPPNFDPDRDLPPGFMKFYRPLHDALANRQQELRAKRSAVLAAAHRGTLPDHLGPSEATDSEWRIEVPDWCRDQRNQMTGPADDAELVVKMLNSGAPGVMLDLEDSMANRWESLMLGVRNIVAALHGTLTYEDRKRGGTASIRPSATVIWNRVRGLHLGQAGIVDGAPTSASLFDLALIAYQIEPDALRHPLCFY